MIEKIGSYQESDRVPFEELEMLLSLYVPVLAIKANELKERCQKYGPLLFKLQLCDRENRERYSELRKESDGEHAKIKKEIYEIKSGLSEQIKEYAN